MVMGLEGNLEIKVVNFVLVDVLFFQLERYILVSESFGVPFRGCTVYIYIERERERERENLEKEKKACLKLTCLKLVKYV
jgi:hypothetical protein